MNSTLIIYTDKNNNPTTNKRESLANDPIVLINEVVKSGEELHDYLKEILPTGTTKAFALHHLEVSISAAVEQIKQFYQIKN